MPQFPWTVYLYGISPCTGGFAFGYDTGSMSGILAMPQFLTCKCATATCCRSSQSKLIVRVAYQT